MAGNINQNPGYEGHFFMLLWFRKTAFSQGIQTFEEVGSGMKDDRPKLRRLFKLIEQKKIDKVIVEHKDRLSRFMVGFLKDYFASHDVEIEWMGEIIGTSYEQELVEDILSLMSSFSNRIYGRRSAENRKARKLMEEQLKAASK